MDNFKFLPQLRWRGFDFFKGVASLQIIEKSYGHSCDEP